MTAPTKRICIGVFAGAHGVRGDVRVKSFTEPPSNLTAYGAVSTKDGAEKFTLTLKNQIKTGVFLASAPEITDRETAEALKGVKLFIERAELPATKEDEFYIEDLIGMAARDETGRVIGRVKAVRNFGAGDILELAGAPGANSAAMIAFTKRAVPQIDLKTREITINTMELAGDGDVSDNESA